MNLKGGSTVLHYRIERRLGTGGMGEVYLARDTKLDRAVAIKFLSAPEDERGRRRLLREARAAAALADEPGICAVFDVGTDSQHGDFLVMQYVEGELLADRLRGGRLETVNALEIGAGIADALAAAHLKGIVHRDLKPQNVIITPAGRPVLLDFGLAKRALSGTALNEAQTSAALTKPYSMIGTPGYMSPEQIRHGRVDRRSDLFALGCVLYECLTGQRAFPGPTAADAIGQVLHTDPPPVTSVVPDIVPGVDALCAHLLQRDVRERCQTAEEAFGAIRALLPPGTAASGSTRRSRTVTLSWRWRYQTRPVTIAAVAAAVIAAAGGAWWVWGREPRLHVPLPEAQKWFDRGVTAIREGAYAGARSDFEEAVRLDPRYAQAYARLADARSELDDQRNAQSALLRVNELVPNRTDLPARERLRLEAVTASVLPDPARAVTAYAELATLQPADAAAWLDLGRAQEAAYRLVDAQTSYTKAIDLDRQYAAAHARLGFLQVTPPADAIAHLDEAARLSRIAADLEGENEALLRKGVLLSGLQKYDDARDVLQQVVTQTSDPKYVTQHLRAQFALVLPLSSGGKSAAAVDLGQRAVDAATAAGLRGLAANGLIDVGSALLSFNHREEADALFARAVSLAAADGSRRTEMRAQLQRAAGRQFAGHPQEALDLCAAPYAFFSENRYVRFEVSAQNVMSRAYGDLERYAEGIPLAGEVLTAAETAGNNAQIAGALETRAGMLRALGRFPEALDDRQRLEGIHRRQHNQIVLPFDLANRAGLLIDLGHDADARTALDEVDRGIADGLDSYKGRAARLVLLRALQASVARRFEDVLKATRAMAIASGTPADDTALETRLVAEHARAALGRSTVPTADMAVWLDQTHSAEFRRELAYWLAATLVLRGDKAGSAAVSKAALAEAAGAPNFELRWRLEALAARAGSGTPDGATMPALARADLQRLGDQWGGSNSAAFQQYLARPDLSELRRAIQ